MLRNIIFLVLAVVVFFVAFKLVGREKELPIKGNAPQMIYHLPDCPSYFSVIVKEDQGDKLFKTEKEAQEAGFRKAKNCP